MTFLPDKAAVPAERRTSRLHLRPLRATDVDRDYDAVMASTAMLRQWSQTDWPADDFTLAENLADLERHEREHLERVAFTFTVLDPGGDRCLGCVYVSPLRGEEAAFRDEARYPARAGFWVRTVEIARDLDRHLLATLLDWFRAEWAFDRVVFAASPNDERQIGLFEAAPLTPLGEVTLADGRRVSAYLGS